MKEMIFALLDINGNAVVKYTYDAWGNHDIVDANGKKKGTLTISESRTRSDTV